MMSLDTAGELYALDPAAFARFLALGTRVPEAAWAALLDEAGVDGAEREELEATLARAEGEVDLAPAGGDSFPACRVVAAAAVAAAARSHWTGAGGRTLSSVASAHPPEDLTGADLGAGAGPETLAAWQGLFAVLGFPAPAFGEVVRPAWLAGYEDDHVGLLSPAQAARVADGLAGDAVERAVEALGLEGCEADDVRAAAAFVDRAAACGRWVLGAQAAT